MIQKLKHKVLLIIMIFVTLIIAAFITVVNVVPAVQENRAAELFLSRLAENDGVRQPPAAGPPVPGLEVPGPPGPGPAPDNPEGGGNPFALSNITTVRFDDQGAILSWFYDRQDLFDEADMKDLAEKVYAQSRPFGKTGGYYFFQRDTSYGKLLILLDNRRAFDSAERTALLSALMGLGVWSAFLVLSIFLVNNLTRPVGTAFQKQRQFISDAGHELKTPISVISANSEVLRAEIGENKWLAYIESEAKRMEALVQSLMTLSQIDDEDQSARHSDFELSSAVLSAALPFESMAFEKGMLLETDIEPDILLHGDEEKIKRLVIILINNAIKYGNEQGIIRIDLKREHKKTCLSVYNTGQGVPAEEMDKLFDRFYRADKSRSRADGSYGLGLAIAKAVAEEHGGRISVRGEFGSWIQFDVALPA